MRMFCLLISSRILRGIVRKSALKNLTRSWVLGDRVNHIQVYCNILIYRTREQVSRMDCYREPTQGSIVTYHNSKLSACGKISWNKSKWWRECMRADGCRQAGCDTKNYICTEPKHGHDGNHAGISWTTTRARIRADRE